MSGGARLVVTGGVGFIGYHLTRALLERGDEVVVIDDLSDAPYPAAEKRRNLADLEGLDGLSSQLRFLHADITDRAAISRAFEGATGVFHLAGLAGVRPSFADPAKYMRVNAEGTATVLEVAREQGIERVVFASSSSVYGNDTRLPASEEASASAPESPYAASKRAAELVASALVRRSPTLRWVGLRYFTVYGPRQRPEMAITLFMRSMLAGRVLRVFGDGSMRRDFTHVDDIVRGTLAAFEGAPCGMRVFNLGSGAPMTLRTLVALLGEVTGVVPQVVYEPQPLGDVDATFADITRARSELGWEPRVLFGDGLQTVLAWVSRGATVA